MVQLLGGQVILVLRECSWNASAVSLVLPAFDGTGSLGSPPSQVVYPWVTASRFLAENWEVERKPTTFS